MSDASTPPIKFYACLSYRDPLKAIDFLKRAFGFVELMVMPDENGGVAHAELALGPEIIMLGSSKPELGWVSPMDLVGRNAAVYGYVSDPDAHYTNAMAAGATAVRPPNDTPYGSREYSVRDPEGHEWHFGTYRPVARDAT